MTRSLLLMLLAAPAAANPAAISATLEALRSQAAADPAALTAGESASVRAGKSFDKGFTVESLTPVEYVPLTGEPRKNPPPPDTDKPPVTDPITGKPAPDASTIPEPDGAGTDYYFEGKKPLNGITIYTPKKGNGSTTEGESPTAKYGTYGKIGVAAGVVALGVGLALGGTPLVVLALVGGLLIGAGGVLAFLFGGKKKK